MSWFKNIVNQDKRILILGLLHLVGWIGMFFHFNFFSSLSPYFLITVYIVLFTGTEKLSADLISALLLIAFFGFGIEIFGVETGIIFGNYKYLDNLGYKLMHVPVLIGVNWAILIYVSNQIFKNIFHYHGIKRYFLSSLLLVFFDWLIELQAPQLGFWQFDSGLPGFSNYLAWFLISFILSFLFGNAITRNKNELCLPFIIIQSLFFILMNFI